jgi:hypothetical protein
MNVVNNWSIEVQGGLQCLITLDGYAIPIDIVDGLPYIKMRPFTDAAWDNLPHVVLTSNVEWDPTTVLDHSLDDDEHWFEAVCDLEKHPYTSMFDAEGNYLHHVIAPKLPTWWQRTHFMTFHPMVNQCSTMQPMRGSSG